MLAELAQGLAAELATHFDDLPMHPFTGRVPRAPGTWGWLVPPRAVPHRVVLGRYLSLTVPQNAGSGYTVCGARIAVVGLGADGVLRRGELWEMITLPEGVESTTDALPWDDMRLRRVPSRAIRLVRWGGDAQAGRIASPAEVIDALTRVASAVADVAARDLALLDRLMGGAAR
ncbi:hypothetical protein J421_0698 [Gemmatirosa kalamazoonensis]|uniref:Uncharacterized protein n=1 Tax=Gemmatirosa kalamazoonensis TaxID=861299 RepID=W0RD51_9BACT|nr:hypothetical protein [Gemmatirosa kalamazoonensis]AHG88235.1 hypothetical protein J421_0698 [Gemmatirosa kalamazoonensis]